MSATSASGSAPDPTRSVERRRRLVQEFRRRWRDLRGEIRDAIDRNDQFGLSNDDSAAAETTAAAILARFRRWLRQQVEELIVEPLPIGQVKEGMHWTGQFVREAYEHGLGRADTGLQQSGYESPEVSPAAAILRDRHQEPLRGEVVRTYHGVKNAADAVVKDLSQTFDELQEADASRRQIADVLNERVETVGPNSHTDALAHGVIVVAINRASIVRYRQAGVEAVGAVVEETAPEGEASVTVSGPVSDDPEAISAGAPADPDRGVRWRTAQDNRVCPQCRRLAGKTWPMTAYESGDAPIPVRDTHPRCRCWLVPIPKNNDT